MLDKTAIFRREAIEFVNEGQDTHGDPIARLPNTWNLASAFFILFIFASSASMALLRFDHVVELKGTIRSSAAEAQIVLKEPGYVQRVYVAHGQSVNEGDPLALIGTVSTLADGADAEALEAEATKRELYMVTAERDALVAEFDADHALLEQEIEFTRSEVNRLSEEVALVTERVAIAEDRYSAAQQWLDEGLIAAIDLQRYQDQYVISKQGLLEVRSRLAAAHASIDTVRSRMTVQAATKNKSIASIEQKLIKLRTRQRIEEQKSTYMVKSPTSGKVSLLGVDAGESVQANNPIMIVSRNTRIMNAELLVPPDAVAFVKKGMSLRVKLVDQALPEVNTEFDAIVTNMTSTTMPMGTIGEGYFRVEAEVDTFFTGNLLNDIELKSGMSLTANLSANPQTALQWLFD